MMLTPELELCIIDDQPMTLSLRVHELLEVERVT